MLFRSEHLRAQRPRTRGECVGGPRPCPWASCRYHLAVDVQREGVSLKLNFPDMQDDFSDMPDTCALDVADRGGSRLEDVAVALNVTRERIRQLEGDALAIVHPTLLGHADDPESMKGTLAHHIRKAAARSVQRADPEHRAKRAEWLRDYTKRFKTAKTNTDNEETDTEKEAAE